MTSSISDNRSVRRARAFTLIELLVVMGVILLLMGLIIPAVMKATTYAGRARQAADLQTIASALEQYAHEFQNNYPQVLMPNTGAAVLGKALMALGPTADPVAAYDSTRPYAAGEWVQVGGTVYEALIASTGQSPPNATYWVSPPPTLSVSAQPYNSALTYAPGAVVTDGAATPAEYVAITQVPASVAVTNVDYFVPFQWGDGAGASQFRSRPGAAAHDAYIQAGVLNTNGTDILDRWGNPILYFPGTSAMRNVNLNQGYIAVSNLPTDTTAAIWKNLASAPGNSTALSNYQKNKAASLFDPTDNIVAFRRSGEMDDTQSIRRLCAMLGDADPKDATRTTNFNGAIDVKSPPLAAGAPPETVIAQGQKFLLWSAGADGMFGPGPKAVSVVDTPSADDVTNFR